MIHQQTAAENWRKAVMSCKEGEGFAELKPNSQVTDHSEALL